MAVTTLQEILLSHLEPSTTASQVLRRKAFDKAKLVELAESIKTNGLVQPIVVRPVAAKSKVAGHYEIVAGERRFLAAKIAQLERIPCTVRELTDEQVVELQLIENLQREDVHPMHEAESYEELIHKYGHVADELAARVGKSRSYVYGRIKLLALSKACRKAFYGGEISASIAEKIARIPTHALQDQALELVLGNPNAKHDWQRSEPMSYRQASAAIAERFMLDLSQASFPTEDEKLAGAGPCTTCPKRAGNQPELFADVKKGDTCTDPSCFAAKTRAFGQRTLELAKQAGTHTVLSAALAKKIAPNGVGRYGMREGYKPLDEEVWVGNRSVVPRKVLKPDAEIAIMQDPVSGRAVELVHESQLKAPKREQSSTEQGWRKERKEQAAKAKTETAIRRAVFAAIHAQGKWKAPPTRVVAELLAEAMDYDAGEALMDLLAVPEAKTKGYYDRLQHYVAGLKTDAQLQAFIAQAYLAGELHVNSYRISTKAPRLEAAAKAVRVDVAKIRREHAPKKTKKKGGKR